MELPVETYRAHTRPTLSHLNVGSGVDCSIREFAETIARVTGFKGRIVFDTSKPDGTPRKIMDSAKLFGMGWKPSIGLKEGLRDAYNDFLQSGQRRA